VSAGARCLTLAVLVLACRGESEMPRDVQADTIAPIGTGTERLLTRERLALLDEWVRASIARDGKPPTSLDAVRPPERDASRYVPLERFLRDGWGRAIAYEYTPASRSYELRSPGQDGALHTADDLTQRGTL
jgi:hypothetical protein